jgi:hypothetical protein
VNRDKKRNGERIKDIISLFQGSQVVAAVKMGMSKTTLGDGNKIGMSGMPKSTESSKTRV